MNNPDFHKEKPSLQLLGKGFMIVVVVIFSGLSFTLGYFVGKSNMDGKSATPPSQAAEMAQIPQRQETAVLNQPAALAQPQNASVAENKNTPQTGAAANRPVESRQKGQLVIVETKKPEPEKAASPAKEKPALQHEAQPVTEQSTKGPVKELGKEPLKKPAAKDSSASEDSRKLDGPVYTVQLAAFKSASEAKSFSKKHAKKGLKTYITTSTSKNKVKIYKVKSGEFKDRKDAETVSLKLNKTTKLKTFVTLKGE